MEKPEVGRVREENSRRGKIREEQKGKMRRKKMAREKVEKSRFTAFFLWFVAPEGRKVGSLKGRVRRHLGRWEMKNCTPLRRKAHFQVKMHKTHHVRSTFGSWDVEKVHVVVARSTVRSQNVQNTPRSDRFQKLRCRKSARRCGVKHISRSPLLDVQMSFRVASARDCAPCQKREKWDRETDRQTDGRTDGQTDRQDKVGR